MTGIDLGVSLVKNPRLAQWVEFSTAGGAEVVLLRPGKVELGQGIVTALVQIAAEELDVDLWRVQPQPCNTVTSPDEGMTAGSRSVMDSGHAIRLVCAEVRSLLLDEAARRHGVPRETLVVADGRISTVDGRAVTDYWRLDPLRVLDVPATGTAPVKPPAHHTVVGQPSPRLDLSDKFAGRPRFVQDLALPGQLFARVVRPPAPGARLDAVDDKAARAVATVRAVIRHGSFLAVVAEREEEAVRAAEKLRAGCEWRSGTELTDSARVLDQLAAQPTDDVLLAGRADPAPAERVTHRYRWTYRKPYIAHASIAPGSATALWSNGRLQVWTHSQGVYPLRAALAVATGVAVEQIVVQHVENAGCYGHNSADDAACDAALIALELPGRPVQVCWSRDDEFAWEPYSPAALTEVTVGVDAAGDVVQWRQQTWSGGHDGRPGYAGQHGLLGRWHADESEIPAAGDYPLAFGGGVGRNGIPGYDIAALEVVASRVLTMPVRTSSLRGLGATANVFAIESAMDELAELAGADPLEYRLRHLSDPRAKEVLQTVAGMADWGRQPEVDSVGWGIAYSRYKNICGYCAVVARVEAISEVRVSHLYLAVDAGQVINPDGLRNQVEGGAIQATSWTLLEEVGFDAKTVLTRDWESYPILRFSEVPRVEVELVSRPDERPLGVGEVAGGPVTAAIVNALADAIGVRMRRLPLTAQHIAAAITDG
jgi:CO/xanthine dehydrogenase Mo-binding subunit